MPHTPHYPHNVSYFHKMPQHSPLALQRLRFPTEHHNYSLLAYPQRRSQCPNSPLLSRCLIFPTECLILPTSLASSRRSCLYPHRELLLQIQIPCRSQPASNHKQICTTRFAGREGGESVLRDRYMESHQKRGFLLSTNISMRDRKWWLRL